MLLDSASVDTMTPTDEQAIRRLADAMLSAEIAGDAAFFAGVLAPDVVIMPSGVPPIVGLGSCLEFIHGVLDDVLREFDRDLGYVIDEIHVHGDFAFDRGTFTQILVPKLGGPTLYEQGQFLRVYARIEGRWKLARVCWSQWVPEGADEGAC